MTNFRKTGAFPNLTLMTKLSYLDKSTCDKLLTKKHRCLNLIIIVKRVYKYRVVDMWQIIDGKKTPYYYGNIVNL